ncbi:MAG: metal ABC transporter substrate-binding protein [Kiritimatiellia bacterium]
MKRQFNFGLACFLFWFLVLGRHAGAQAGGQKQSVVVTTTLVETAVRDLLGNSVNVVRLLPPGSCPGHFDLEPSQVQNLLGARLFIRHDFQDAVDTTLRKSRLDPGRIVALPSRSALTIPTNYVAMCAALAEHLTKTWPERGDGIRAALDRIRKRANEAEEKAANLRSRLRGRRVLCAQYQREFCAWLGLEIAAIFQAGTDESAWQLARAIDMARIQHAQAVVGNLQWGPRHLKALAEATGLPGIMLSNFPESGEADAYWQLFSANLEALARGLP